MVCSIVIYCLESISHADLRRWIGEKYDGVRICWNGMRKQLYLILQSSFGDHIGNDKLKYSRSGMSIGLPVAHSSVMSELTYGSIIDCEAWYVTHFLKVQFNLYWILGWVDKVWLILKNYLIQWIVLVWSCGHFWGMSLSSILFSLTLNLITQIYIFWCTTTYLFAR